MYRFLLRPKWIGFHLLVVAAIVTMVNLAFWQMRRLDERKDFNAEVRGRSTLPVEPITDVVDPDTDAGDIEWRTVTATGTYLADEQVVVINRSQDGFAGKNVVTPLELEDGTLVLVNRGFVEETTAVPAPPSGDVEVTGRVRASQRRSLGQISDPAEGELTEVQRIDIPRLAEQLPGPVLPVYVDLLTSEPSQGAIPIPLPDPELTEGPHLSYTIQWFIFSVAVAVGWVLAVRSSIAKRRAAAVSAANEGSAPAANPPGDDEAPTAPS